MEEKRFQSVHLLSSKTLSDGGGDGSPSWEVGALGVDQADVEADLVHVPRGGRRPRVAEGGRGRGGGRGRVGGVRAELRLGVQDSGGGSGGEGGGRR